MKKLIVSAAALALALGQLNAMGISPSRAEQGGNPANSNNNGAFQMQPAPQPSNNLMNPGGPALQGAPLAQPAVNQEQQIENNIKNYKPADWAKAWNHVTLEEAKKMHGEPGVLFCDARAKVEYDEGHIPGAIPLPLGEFDKYFLLYHSKITKATKLVTYCHGVGCMLSDKVAQKLHDEKKFHNVSAFFGGWPQWQDAKLPIEVSTAPGAKK